ncbi:CDP-diacylglycerol--serine O-phosphatidyltransferase [Syntrophomonas palmitatica]|uniref:CDP-diacylglycerol--serine O-phosphatidyltransferase n=1 Tax=Syntrophomonas palmitatica TaxID=402877 RepID=UPI000A5CC55D|nr:CDP-diacylglycerol--serine O-phosphatidyltransferase [Syntrophomonas palmitatica]
MDGMDGRIARRFNSTSEFGRELDSLCDLVSFGVAPAVLLYAQVLDYHTGWLGLLAAVFYIGCGAYRLARFNVLKIDDYFVGIPITLAGALMAFVSIGAQTLGFIFTIISLLIVSFLMISTIRIPKL